MTRGRLGGHPASRQLPACLCVQPPPHLTPSSPALPLPHSWRVEAEVKMELERLRANGGAEAAAAGAGAAGGRMAEELAAAKARVAALEGDVSKWEAALAARDVELQNLQRALGAG